MLDGRHELDLTGNQLRQAEDRRGQADQTVAARLLGSYHWVLAPAQPDPGAPFVIEVSKAEGQSGSLAERVSRRLGADGALNTQQAASMIRLKLDQLVPTLWEAGHVRLGDLWKVYTQYPYMPRLRTRQVLAAGLSQQPLLPSEGLAFADSFDEVRRRYQGLTLGHDAVLAGASDDLLVVKPELAAAQVAAEQPRRVAEDGEEPEPGPDAPSPGFAGRPDSVFPDRPVKMRFFGAKELGVRYAVDFRKVADEVLAHLAATPGVELSVRIEIEATAAAGFDEGRVRTVSENAHTLRFEAAGFEDS